MAEAAAASRTSKRFRDEAPVAGPMPPHFRSNPIANVAPELRALRAVLQSEHRDFAVQCGVLPTELIAFETGEAPLSQTLAAGLRRALAQVPDAWRHAFPTLKRLTEPRAPVTDQILVSRTEYGVDSDGTPFVVEVTVSDDGKSISRSSVTQVMRRRPDDMPDTPRVDFRGGTPLISDPLEAGRPLTGKALGLLRERRRLSVHQLAHVLDSPAADIGLVEAHLAPVPRDWAGRLNAALGTAFSFPPPPEPSRHEF